LRLRDEGESGSVTRPLYCRAVHRGPAEVGSESNSPVVRIGNIAMLSKVRIRTGEPYRNIEAYLVEGIKFLE
jgi:hypothetical protein